MPVTAPQTLAVSAPEADVRSVALVDLAALGVLVLLVLTGLLVGG